MNLILRTTMVLFLFVTPLICEGQTEQLNNKKTTQDSKRPNILFVLADDKSWLHTGAFGDKVVQKEMFRVIIKKRTLIQQAIAKNITLKYTPVIEFIYDGCIEAGDKVLAMINELENI